MLNTIFNNTFLAFYAFKNLFFSFLMEQVYNDHLFKTKDLSPLAYPIISVFALIIFHLLDKHFITTMETFIIYFSKTYKFRLE